MGNTQHNVKEVDAFRGEEFQFLQVFSYIHPLLKNQSNTKSPPSISDSYMCVFPSALYTFSVDCCGEAPLQQYYIRKHGKMCDGESDRVSGLSMNEAFREQDGGV